VERGDAACGLNSTPAAGNEVTSQARQQQQHYLPLGWTAAAFPATPATWFYSELSGDSKALCLDMSHIHFVAVTTALNLSINSIPDD
jgi:hypothetical protein